MKLHILSDLHTELHDFIPAEIEPVIRRFLKRIKRDPGGAPIKPYRSQLPGFSYGFGASR